MACGWNMFGTFAEGEHARCESREGEGERERNEAGARNHTEDTTMSPCFQSERICLDTLCG